MIKNELPVAGPYLLESGEGERYLLGTFLATIIGRSQDTGGPMAGCILSGAKGSVMPLHKHQDSHEVIFVMEGLASLELANRSYELVPGDYVSIPPGTMHGFTFSDHRTKFLTWTFGGNANELYPALGKPSTCTVHNENGDAVNWGRSMDGIDVTFDLRASFKVASPAEKETKAPAEMRPYVLQSGEGERMVTADHLYTILTDRRQSGGAFLVLLTEGPKGPMIGRHFHERHTEAFFCLDGSMAMIAGDEPLALTPGDLLHVPPGTIHAFQLTGNVTRFIGFLAPGIFEPFFRYLCDPYDGHRFPQVARPFRFDRVLAHLPELDLKLIQPPGGETPGGSGA